MHVEGIKSLPSHTSSVKESLEEQTLATSSARVEELECLHAHARRGREHALERDRDTEGQIDVADLPKEMPKASAEVMSSRRIRKVRIPQRSTPQEEKSSDTSLNPFALSCKSYTCSPNYSH